MARSIIGARIRERRRALGITQAELARRIGISASYLNLIERNRRGVAGKRLGQIAEALGLRLGDLDGAAERRMVETLQGIANDPRLAGLGIEADSVGELIGRYPGWARALGALARSEQEASELARAFSDRLSHDPFLGKTVHHMLTRIAAIRSTAEILEAEPDIDADQAGRFQAILATESRNLSEAAEALAAYFDRAATEQSRVTPTDEVEALFEDNANRFPTLEAALAGARPAENSAEPDAALEARAEPVIERLIAEAPAIETASAKTRARAALLRYAADARAAPLPDFAGRAAGTDYDIERLAAQSGLPIDLICRRLTALPTEDGHPRFGYVAANAAGALTDLRSVPGFHPPRHGTVCPLWALCRASQTPERAIRQLAAFPNGQRFVFVARTRYTSQAGFGQARHIATDMLVMREADATRTVYGTAGPSELSAEEVGTTCRICLRKGCAHRVEDPLAG